MISQHKIIEANELCPKYKFEGIIKDRNTEEQRVESVNKTNEGNAIRDKLEEAEAEERRGSSWRPLTDEPPKAGGAEGKKKQGGKTAQQADIQGVQDSMIESLRKNVELLSIEDDFSSYREQDPDKSAPADTSEEVAASESSDVSYKTLENNQQDKPLGGDVVESIGSWVKLDKAPAEEGWVDVETGFDWEDNYAGEQIAAKKTWWTW